MKIPSLFILASLPTLAFGASANLTWNDASVDELGFRVERRENPGTFSLIGDLPANSQAFTDLGPLGEGQEYCWRVVAYNGFGATPSAEACASIPVQGTAPDAPNNLQVEIVETSPAPPLPELVAWETNMLTYGDTHCTTQQGRDPNSDAALADTYYDQLYVFRRIAEYTGDEAKWGPCAETARVIYGDNYVNEGNGQIPGYWNFSDGFRRDWEVNATVASRQAVIDLANSASYCTSFDWNTTTEAQFSREAAYCLHGLLNLEAIGEPGKSYRDGVYDIVKGHVDQWFITKDFRAPSDSDVPACVGKYYLQPFMVGITMQALIHYWEDTDQDDAGVFSAVKAAADQIWLDAWVPGDQAFWYDNCKDNPTDPWPMAAGAPDLNLLIAGPYLWLYERTGDTSYRDKFDAIFAGGVRGAWLGNGKQFNQNYERSIDAVIRRTGR